MNHSQKASEIYSGAVSRQLTLDEKEGRENYKKLLEKPFPDRQLAHHSEIQRVEWQRLSRSIKRHVSC